MANPFGYGDSLGFSREQLANTGLFPTQWVEEAMSLAMPSVYFPLVTPMRTELERGPGDAIVVPMEGEMVDTSWPSLTEGTSITVGSYNLDAFAVTIKEAGRGLAVERLVQQYLVNGINVTSAQNFTNKLARNFAMSWENQLRGLYLNGDFVTCSVAAGSYSAVSKSEHSVTGTITVEALEICLDNFRGIHTGTLGTFVIPPYDDGLYRFVGNWKTIKGLLSDSDWRTLQTQNDGYRGQGLIYQELGPWNGFMIVRHDMMPDGTCIAHGRNVAAQAFGGRFDTSDIPAEDLQQIVDPVPFQIRYERDWKNDFYRTKAAAWYTLAGSSAALQNTGTACIRVAVAT